MFLSFTDPNPAMPAPCIAAPPGDTSQFDSAEAIYQRLMYCSDPDDRFDHHVVACILALAAWEASAEDKSLAATTGLDPTDLTTLIDGLFPHAVHLFAPNLHAPPLRSTDEACLLDLLVQCATDDTAFQVWLAAMIARRAQSPNHLWQDLGLRNRGELSRLMTRHFRPLAARNSSDMKWKKFLYRMICRDAGYSICTAPSCSECTDFEYCFGDESGESRLARVRRTGDLVGDGISATSPG
jgi:nitrogen fixation protein NifQ